MGAALKLAPVATAPAAQIAERVAAPASLLRFITCGSVDDGKSTLIGRLLFEAGAVPEDVKAQMIADSARQGAAGGALDYSLLVDGLSAEREQGITIDVAYRYFATPRRAFIVADTPGHEQYTRNMATGASNAEAALILIDARKGVLPQTRRHSLICALVGVKRVVACVNKIDLIGYDETKIRAIEEDYRSVAAGLGFRSVDVIPVSAREGDNIVAASARTPWRAGPTLLDLLETLDVADADEARGFSMPVQWVNRPDLTFRGFAGTIASGVARPGDEVIAQPSGRRAKIERIVTFDGDLAEAGEGQSVTLTLDREIDVGRGDALIGARDLDHALRPRTTAFVRLLATADRDIRPGDSFVARIGAAAVNARIEAIEHGVDISTFEERQASQLQMNDLALVRLRFDAEAIVAPYATHRDFGALILIDRLTNATAAMGVVIEREAKPAARAKGWRGVLDVVGPTLLGDDWRAELAPAATWRVGSAGLLGLAAAGASGSATIGVAAALADGAARPALRGLHRAIWAKVRARRGSDDDIVADGGGI
jgi:sulfate adenylyltransferase large subunit